MFSFLQTWKAHLKTTSETKGKQTFYGPAEGQAVHVTLEAVAQASGFAHNEVMDPAFVKYCQQHLNCESECHLYIATHLCNCQCFERRDVEENCICIKTEASNWDADYSKQK